MTRLRSSRGEGAGHKKGHLEQFYNQSDAMTEALLLPLRSNVQLRILQ